MRKSNRAVDCLSVRLGRLLVCRQALRGATFVFLVWGTVGLILRLVASVPVHHLIPGLLLVVPVAVVAAIRAWRQRPDASVLRATLDSQNHLGGLLLAEAEVDVGTWISAMPPTVVPRCRWDSRRALALFAAAAVFASLVLLAPDRYAFGPGRRPLEIGKLVKELEGQLDALAKEKVIDIPQAAEVKEKLAKLAEDASGFDPAKTWEALDHLQKSTADSAKKAAEDSLARLETLSQAETLAAALSSASSSNLNEQVSAQAMRELGALLQSARAEEGVLAGSLPPELLAALKTNGLSADQMRQLMRAIHSGKGRMGEGLTNLANLQWIDSAMLGKCAGACQNGDTNALAAFLSECDSTNEIAKLVSYGRGGRDRGRGDAPMTWSEGTSEDDAKFKAEALPRRPLSAAQQPSLVGISRSAPQLANPRESTTPGALAPANSGGGSAQYQAILPRHKPAVDQYFKRDN